MSVEPEHEIREHFRVWRAEVERSVPPFADTISRAFRRAQPAARIWRVRAAIVGMVCLLAAAAGIVMRQPDVPQNAARHENRLSASSSSLVAWSSPTAYLLETPDRKLLRERPRFEPVFYLDRRLP